MCLSELIELYAKKVTFAVHKVIFNFKKKEGDEGVTHGSRTIRGLLAPKPEDFPPTSPLWTQMLPKGPHIMRTNATYWTHVSSHITHQIFTRTQGRKFYSQPGDGMSH